MAGRLKAMGQPHYINGFQVACHPDALALPLGWKKPQRIFVNSMSDLFHERVPLAFIQSAFEIMNRAHWHTYQILTKRAGRLGELAPALLWGENIWMGVTVEAADYKERIDYLRHCTAKHRFLSLEPLLEPLGSIDLTGIDWVIVGGESGPGARLMEEEWVLDIKSQCDQQGVAFFFKQWGGVQKKKAGRMLLGRTWDDSPLLATRQ
jgi:protein gp37